MQSSPSTSPFINGILIRGKQILLICLDYLFLLVGIFASHLVFEYPQHGIIPKETGLLWALLLVFIFLIQFSAFYTSELYVLPSRHKRTLKNKSVFLLACISFVLLMVAVFCYATKFALGRDVLILAGFISFVGSILNRLILVQLFSRKYLGLIQQIRCFVVGKGPLAEQLQLEQNFIKKYKVIDFNFDENLDCLEDTVQELGIEQVIVDSSSETKISNVLLEKLIELKFQGIQVIDAGSFFEKTTSKVPLLFLTGKWFLNTQVFDEIPNMRVVRTKRIFDLLVTICLLPFALPLVILSGLLMKLTSPGDAIYTQKRVGENGKEFTVYKLRSMIVDSEVAGAQWTEKNDPRITPIGKILRSLRIDELPQLWNVLVGEMSLIGPRPERPEFTKKLAEEIPYYNLRHSIRPGLSGWAQINEPLASPSDSLEKLEYDLFYIRNLSLWLELDIILQTIKVILMRQGR